MGARTRDRRDRSYRVSLGAVWAVGVCLMALPAAGEGPLRTPSIPEFMGMGWKDGDGNIFPDCPKDIPGLVETPESEPAYRVARTGIVKVFPEVKQWRVQFDLGPEPEESERREGFVSIEWVKPRDSSWRVCGKVKNGVTYRLPDALPVGDEDKLVVRLYDLPRGEAEQKRSMALRDAREKELLTPALVERERAALRGQPWLRKIAEVAEQLADVPPPPGGVKELATAVEDALATLDQLLGCPQNEAEMNAEPPLFRELCAEAVRIRTSLDGVARRLIRYQNALGAREFQSQRAALLVDLQEAARKLDAGGQPEGEVRDAHCQAVAVLSWLREDSAARWVAQVELPLASPGEVVSVQYKTGAVHAVRPLGTPLAVLVQKVPAAEQLGSLVSSGKRQQQQGLSQSLADFVMFAARALGVAGPGSRVLGVAPIDPQGSPLAPKVDRRWPTLVCETPGFKIDAGSEPLSSWGTRSLFIGRLEAGAETVLHICDKSPCDAKPDNPQLRNTVTLEPEWESSFPVLVELAGTAAPVKGLSFGSPKYEPIGGPSGPQRIYELGSTYEAQDAFSVSLLFGYQFHRRLALALGPSVLVGASGGIFSQLNLRMGVEVSRGAWFTFGPSLRFVKSATGDAPLGSRITVDNRDGAKVPEPRTEYRPRLGLSLGVSVDVSTLAEAGKGLLKAVGVTP
ncbi:hypothetical protein POL68_23340 [Stigmatella sp. ncwal1]|uniref:Uncharacterized protein n=1 Tax=Stigmatella ashevillensis TaxID=2995309 RepID=A0ABT5DE41_9BACT|nr:hypothetical protein [Stigmatella ashevillena]MDC0711425.1 hypothetical protein [Stigmatella ashevillena]